MPDSKWRLEDLPEEMQELVQSDTYDYMMYLREMSAMARKAQRSRTVSPSMGKSPPYEGPQRRKHTGEKQQRSVGCVQGKGSLHHLPPVAYRKPVETLSTPSMRASSGPLMAPGPSFTRTQGDVKERRLRDHLARHHNNEWRRFSLPPVIVVIKPPMYPM